MMIERMRAVMVALAAALPLYAITAYEKKPKR